jgi:hypothetical protein
MAKGLQTKLQLVTDVVKKNTAALFVPIKGRFV